MFLFLKSCTVNFKKEAVSKQMKDFSKQSTMCWNIVHKAESSLKCLTKGEASFYPISSFIQSLIWWNITTSCAKFEECQIMLLFHISFEKKVLHGIIYHCRIDVAAMCTHESLYIRGCQKFGIKVYWRLQFLEYLRTLSLKFQNARTKIEVVLTLPCWLSQQIPQKL